MKIPSRLFRLELNKNQRLKVYDLILFNAAGEGGLCMDFNTSLNSEILNSKFPNFLEQFGLTLFR